MANRQVYALNAATADITYVVPVQVSSGATELQKLSIGSLLSLIPNDSIGFGKLPNLTGLSVLGNGTNASSDAAEITAATDGQVLRRSGTALGFGAVDLAAAGATTGALGPAKGGTGFTTYVIGDLLYADTTSSLAKLPDIATGNVLRSGGAGAAPAWGKVNVAADITGTLPGTSGGTGQTTYAVGDLLVGAAANSTSKLPAVATGNVLTSAGVTTAPAWGKVDMTSHVTGVLPVANGGTGTATGLGKRVIAQGINFVPSNPNGAAPTTFVGGSGEYAMQGFAFDKTIDESIGGLFRVPSAASLSAGVTVKFCFHTTDTSGNSVVWLAAFRRIDNAEDWDTTVHTYAPQSATVAARTTVGQLAYGTITFTSSQIDDFVAGDLVNLRITRDADANVNADAVLVAASVIVEEA
jgi:hypothetical protein